MNVRSISPENRIFSNLRKKEVEKIDSTYKMQKEEKDEHLAIKR